jgi:transcription elongation factor GreA
MKQRLTQRLEKELSALERELRIELPVQIKQAAALGDLSDNAEYQTALERQSFVQLRIGQLRKRLADLSMMKVGDIPRDRVGLGSRVVLHDEDADREVRYELVLPDDGDVADGRISIASPIGKGLMGRQAGDEVIIRVPSGTKVFEVVEFKTLHDLAGEPDDPDERT